MLVSHHVEEIPPGFSHALMLRAGRVVAAGLLDHVLTAENLSATFGMPLLLTRSDDGRWAARREARHRADRPAEEAGDRSPVGATPAG